MSDPLPLACSWPDGSRAEPGADADLVLPPGRPLILRTGAWPARGHVVFPLRYEARQNAELYLHFYRRAEEEATLTVMVGFLPGLDCRFRFDLAHLDAQTLFLERHPGQLKATCLGGRLLPGAIDRAELELQPADVPQALRIGRPCLAAAPGDLSCRAPVLVDRLGQWTGWDWPGKTVDAAALGAELRRELARPPAGVPGLDRYGGDAETAFAATGFFRTEHDGERWWLVDPDGKGFFSSGVDCVRAAVGAAVVPGTEEWYAELPNLRRTPTRTTADFARANLERAFGEDWEDAWRRLTASRLRGWGFNTVANWSDLDFARRAGLPYVVHLRDFPSTERPIFRDLPDVFAPAYERAAAAYAEQLRPLREDPFLVGYFMTNEPKWAFGDQLLASELLETGPGSATRRALVEFLRERHGDEAAWRAAWGLPADWGFDRLVDGCHHRLAARFPAARTDLEAFDAHLIDRFTGVPAAALRTVDPHHLNLGLRFAFIANDRFYGCGRHFDVFSINCYRMLPETGVAEEVDRRCGRPTLIGEFHWGALDRGLLGTGLKGVADQAARGAAFRAYVEACAAHPALVGCHYFQYNDEPCLGRFDGEAWNIGLVDVCQRPYAELVDAARAAHERIYDIRRGRIDDLATPPPEAVRVAH